MTNNIVNMRILTINIDLSGLNEGAHDLLADPCQVSELNRYSFARHYHYVDRNTELRERGRGRRGRERPFYDLAAHEYLSATTGITEKISINTAQIHAVKCRKQSGIINCTWLRASANPLFSGKRVYSFRAPVTISLPLREALYAR